MMNLRRGILAGVVLAVVGVAVVGWWFANRGDAVDLLSSGDPAGQDRAVARLSAAADTPAGLERIAEAVRQKDPVVACSGLRALAATVVPDRPLPPPAVKVVESAVQDKRPPVQVAAIQILEASTPPAPEDPTVPNIVLKAFQTEKAPETRAAAAEALGKFQHWQAMESLVKALEDESVEVRSSAGMAIRRILGLDYGFRANAPLTQRQEAIARIRNGWKLQLIFHLDNVKRIRENRSSKP
jgi:HEAT repeat protein